MESWKSITSPSEEAVVRQLALDSRVFSALYDAGCQTRLQNVVSVVAECTQTQLDYILDSMWEIHTLLYFCAFFQRTEGVLEKVCQWVKEASPGAVHFALNVVINTEIASLFSACLVEACDGVIAKA